MKNVDFYPVMDYIVRKDFNENGDMTIYVQKHGETIHTKTILADTVKANPYYFVSKAIDETREIESERL